MLKTLRLTNFRGFEEHELSFERLTLIVGRNNAGKSTIIEALRLVSLALTRARTLGYPETPSELHYVHEPMGFAPSMRDIEFNLQNLFFRYRRAPAIIEALFDKGALLRIYVNTDGTIFCKLKSDKGFVIGSRQQAASLNLASLNILPQVGPLAIIEHQLTPAYIRRAASSVLASSHFRNQLLIFNDKFDEFRRIAEENWHRFQIKDFIVDAGELRNELQLHVRDDDFVAEVAWMGHGLHSWLQTMWFIARMEGRDAVVLDEPDVYLHADLQRR
jgi:hypothetical protein